jgi:ribosomal protein L40E
MTTFVEFPLLTVFVVVMVVIVLSCVFSPRRDRGTGALPGPTRRGLPPPPVPPMQAQQQEQQRRVCRACGTVHPEFASYCRNCGQRM